MLYTGPDRIDFGDIFQALPLAAVVVRAHAPDYPVVAINDAYRILANSATSDNLIGKSLFDIAPAENHDRIRHSLEAVVASGQPSTVTHQAWKFLHTAVADQGSAVQYITQYIQSEPQVVVDNADASLNGTSSKGSSSRIDASVQHLLQTFEFASTGFVLFDLSGRVLDCNAAFAEALGQTREQLQRAESAGIVHPADREQRNHLMWRLFTGEVPAFTLESRYLRRDGSDSWACDSVSLLRDEDGKPQRIVVISEDISTRKRAEKTLAQTEGLVTMGRLSASIAHELNNPLESVTNLLFLISNGTQLEDMHYYSRLAEQELARVTRIATQTLRFYRPQSAPAPVDLTDVIESVLALFEGRIRRESVKVVRRFRPATPTLTAYSSELRQVFLNLVGNSLDAMPSNGLLQVSVRPSRNWVGNHARGVRVTVCDAGSGIPKAMLQKVFEPFVSTKEQSGTGLGLWISRDIIRRHGGTLHVRSAESGPRRGTCMSVFLPAATERADANAA